MINSQKPTVNDVTPIAEELPTKSVSTDLGISLEDPSNAGYTSGPRSPFKRLLGVSLLGVSIFAGILLALHTASTNKQQTPLNSNQIDQSLRIKPQVIGLTNLGLQPISLLSPASNTLTVNGTVSVAGSVVLNPMPTPTAAVAGQLYFDQAKNQLGYYNGGSFIYLQGGSGTQVTTYNVTNTTNNTVTNVTNIGGSSSNAGVTAPNGTAGDIAMFTASNTLGDSLINESGSTVNVGGSTINVGVANTSTNVTIGTINDSSTLALQGGTGGVTMLSGDTAGTSGTIVIASGASSTTSAGNVSIDTGSSVVNGLVVKSENFETAPVDFNTYTYGAETVSQDCTVSHGGNCSMNITGWGAGGGSYVNAQSWSTFALVPGHQYFFSAYVKAASSSAQVMFGPAWAWPGCGANNVFDNSTTWTHVTFTCVAPAGDTLAWLLAGFESPTTETHYFDDLSVTDLNQSTTAAVLNLGTTNAQEVNIGNNSNQINATSIYGDGINLSAGHGNVNVSGTNTTIAASGIGSFTATGGALTLSGAGGSGSGVIVKPQSDSTNAFQVQNSLGNSLLDVDTSGSTVNLATSAFGTVDLGSVSGVMGNVSVGTTQDHGYQQLIAAEQFSAPGTGSLSSLSAYIGANVDPSPTNHLQLAIYADNGSDAPGAYIASSAVGTITANSWNTLPITATVSSGTKYWLVFWTDTLNGADNGMKYTNSSNQLSRYAYTTGVTFGSGPNNGMPAAFPTPTSNADGPALYSIDATYTLGAVPAVNVDSSGNLNSNGGAVFKDSVSATNAFQIQDTSGNDLINVDTTHEAINIGTAGAASVSLGTVYGSIGYTGIGTAQDTGSQNLLPAAEFTAPATGTLGSMSAFIGPAVDTTPHNEYQFAIYADNGSDVPSTYIASSAIGTITASSWNSLPITASVTAGTKYWLVYWTNTSNNNDNAAMFSTVNGLSHNYAYTTGVTFGSGPDNGLPATFPGPTTDFSSNTFGSTYASYSTSSGTAFNIDSSGNSHSNGAATFKDATSSATAFQIQDSSGVSVFTANTAGGVIDVTNLVATGTLTVNGHIITGGNTPQIAAGAAACTTPTVTVNGTDTAGTISVTTGTGCSASGTLGTITFANKFGANPHITLTPGSAASLALGAYVDNASVSTTGFNIGTNTTPANGTNYQWNYQVLQ